MRRLALWIPLALAALASATHAQQPNTVHNAPPAPPAVQQLPPAVIDVTPQHIPAPSGHADGEHIAAHEEHGHGSLFTFADLLIWRPRWQGMDYAIIDPLNNLVPQGNVEALSLEARAGVRAGLGYWFPGTHWGASVTYTYLRSEDEGGLSANPGGVLHPTLTRPGIIDRVTDARAESRLRYNVFDADLIRDWSPDECFTFRFLGGVRFASVDYALNAFYDGGDAFRAAVATSSDFDGVGPTLGGQGTWKVAKGLGLFARGRGSLLYGEIHGGHRETDRGGAAVLADITNNTARAVPVLDLGVGLSWQYRGLHLAVGYEVTHWFQLAEVPQFVDDFAPGKFVSRQSSLTLDGVFFRAGLEY